MQESDYNQRFDKRLLTRSPEIFGNFTRENARYIIPQFLKSATRSVEILSGSLPDGFYSSIPVNGNVSSFDALEIAAENISKNAQYTRPSIRILTLDGMKSEQLESLTDRINGKHPGIMQVIEAKYSGEPRMKHFLVVDGERYRLEEYHPPFAEPPSVLKAEVCCNGPTKAAAMETLFNTLWDSAQ